MPLSVVIWAKRRFLVPGKNGFHSPRCHSLGNEPTSEMHEMTKCQKYNHIIYLMIYHVNIIRTKSPEQIYIPQASNTKKYGIKDILIKFSKGSCTLNSLKFRIYHEITKNKFDKLYFG